jgi:hypothetical protein
VKRLPSSHPLHLVLGFTVWAVWFVILYGGLSVICAVEPPPVERGILNWTSASLLVGTMGIAATLSWSAWQRFRSRTPQQRENAAAGEDARWPQFVAQASAWLYAAAAISTLVVGLPLLVLAPCV